MRFTKTSLKQVYDPISSPGEMNQAGKRTSVNVTYISNPKYEEQHFFFE